MLHTTHPEIVNRLKRAQGHLRSIVEMIENGRACLDIAQQLHAVERGGCERQTDADPRPHRPLPGADGRADVARRARATGGIQGDNEIPMTLSSSHTALDRLGFSPKALSK
jgi:hypothetical protein